MTNSSNARFSLQALALESLVVVLSVLLALGVDSWREARAERHLALQALQGILDEARTNCAQILTFQAYHDAVVAGETEPQGIQIGLLRNDAWDVAKSIGAPPHLPHDLIASVAAINAFQSDHRTYVQAYVQSLFTLGLTLADADEWHGGGERFVIAELVRTQERLIEAYRQLTRIADEYHGRDVTTAEICAG